MKAANCADCKHFAFKASLLNLCKRGHKPRFYIPQTMAQANIGDFGWKRRCEDFKEMK